MRFVVFLVNTVKGSQFVYLSLVKVLGIKPLSIMRPFRADCHW